MRPCPNWEGILLFAVGAENRGQDLIFGDQAEEIQSYNTIHHRQRLNKEKSFSDLQFVLPLG